MHYFRVPVSDSHCSGCVGVAFEYESGILREMTFLRGCNAWFYSGYMLCVSSLAMDEFHTFFYDAADSNPEAFSPFGRMEKCAQSMLLVAVMLSAVHTLEPGIPFFELHSAAMRDQGPFCGAPVCVSHRCRGGGVAGSCTPR